MALSPLAEQGLAALHGAQARQTTPVDVRALVEASVRRRRALADACCSSQAAEDGAERFNGAKRAAADAGGR